MPCPGGFVVKNPPPMSNREAFMAEGIDCYKTFISGLLDLTDNLVGGSVTDAQAQVYTDFRLDAEGFARMVVCVGAMNPRRLGRTVQRLLEIET